MHVDFLKTNSGKVWYSVYGKGKSGIPLIVVHGGPGFLCVPQIVSEFSTNRPVYLYDQLGCGKTGKDNADEYNQVESYVSELDEVIKELNLSEFILMGFSWGCRIVCSYMLEYEAKEVRAMILSTPCSSSPLWDTDRKNSMERILTDIKLLRKEKRLTTIIMNTRTNAGTRMETRTALQSCFR